MVRRRYVLSVVLLSAGIACSEAGEGGSVADSSSDAAAVTGGRGASDSSDPDSPATTGGAAAIGGATGSGGAAAPGGAASGGSNAGPVCNPSGDTQTAFNNDDHTAYQATGFETGSEDPFVICTTKSPNYGRGIEFDGRNVLEFHWKEESYDGSRMTKGAEACGGPRFHKEGWYGFQFYLPDPGFPKDKTQGIAQIFALGGCSSWASKLRVDNNSLVFSRRHYCGTAVETVIAPDIERNKWHSVVIHFITSQAEQGLAEVWFGDDVCDQATPTYRATGINYGFGEWDTETDSLVAYEIDPDSQGGFREFETNEIEFKIGMYNFDNSDYSEGETRTLYYDNVSMLADEGESAFLKVNPAF